MCGEVCHPGCSSRHTGKWKRTRRAVSTPSPSSSDPIYSSLQRGWVRRGELQLKIVGQEVGGKVWKREEKAWARTCEEDEIRLSPIN